MEMSYSTEGNQVTIVQGILISVLSGAIIVLSIVIYRKERAKLKKPTTPPAPGKLSIRAPDDALDDELALRIAGEYSKTGKTVSGKDVYSNGTAALAFRENKYYFLDSVDVAMDNFSSTTIWIDSQLNLRYINEENEEVIDLDAVKNGVWLKF